MKDVKTYTIAELEKIAADSSKKDKKQKLLDEAYKASKELLQRINGCAKYAIETCEDANELAQALMTLMRIIHGTFLYDDSMDSFKLF